MQITRFEILRVPPSWVWLLVHTDSGLVGLGEPYLEGHPESVIAEVRRLEPLLVGQDPRRTEHLWQLMYRAGTGYRGGPVTMSAISGIDIALWDLKAKAADLPIHELLGGASRNRVRMYRAVASTRPRGVAPGHRAPPHRAEDRVGHARSAEILVEEWGFRALKLHLSPGDGLAVTTEVDRLAAAFAEVRAAVGPSVDVAVDLHNPHPRIALQLIEALAPYRPLFVEEPVPAEAVGSLAAVAGQSRVPLAAGERWMGKWHFQEALRHGHLAVVQPDIAHAGGITECRKIAALAEASFAYVALHCPLSPLALAASLQLDAAIPNFLVQEHNEVNGARIDGQTVIGAGFLAEPFVLDDDGCVRVPDGPGLGVDLDREALAEIMRQPWSQDRG